MEKCENEPGDYHTCVSLGVSLGFLWVSFRLLSCFLAVAWISEPVLLAVFFNNGILKYLSYGGLFCLCRSRPAQATLRWFYNGFTLVCICHAAPSAQATLRSERSYIGMLSLRILGKQTVGSAETPKSVAKLVPVETDLSPLKDVDRKKQPPAEVLGKVILTSI